MITSPGQTSATPILDLLKPLPEPHSERITGRFAAPFLASVGLIVMTENYTFLMVPLGIALILFLTTFVHELGHLVAGWSVGMRFDRIVVGPLVINRSRSGLTLRFIPRIHGGLTYMSFEEVSRIRRRELVSVAGGPFASLLVGAGALIGGEIARAWYDSPWTTFFQFFGVYSLFIGVLSFFPYRAGPHAGDGMHLHALLRSKDRANQLIAAHALGVLKNKTPEGVNWNRRWTQVAYGQPGLATQYHTDWYAYSMAQDPASAAEFLERCLAACAFLEREDRDGLIAEVVRFTAWDRNDPAKARCWYARLRNPERLDQLSRIRMEVAFKSAVGNVDESLEQWQQGLRLIEQSPSSVTAREYEKSWRNWKVQILSRTSQEHDRAEVFV